MYVHCSARKILCTQKGAGIAVNQHNVVYILLMAVVVIQHISVRATQFLNHKEHTLQ